MDEVTRRPDPTEPDRSAPELAEEAGAAPGEYPTDPPAVAAEGDVEALTEEVSEPAGGRPTDPWSVPSGTPDRTQLPPDAVVRVVVVTTAWEPYASLLRAWPAHRRGDEVLVLAHQDQDDPPALAGVVAHRMGHVPQVRTTTPWPVKLDRYRAAVAEDPLLPQVLPLAQDVLVRDSLREVFADGLREARVAQPAVADVTEVGRALVERRLAQAVEQATTGGASEHVLAGLTAELAHLRGATALSAGDASNR